MADAKLVQRLEQAAARAGLEAIGVALHDYENELQLSFHGDRWFHAASTMKAAVLFALLELAGKGEIRLEDSLHVRNRFTSAADGTPFKVDGGRDGDSVVHRRIGRTMQMGDLAHAMITRSSNLATNLLVDFLGVERIKESMERAGVRGVEVVRGVEDERAFEAGLNNRVTAEGLVHLFRLFCEETPLPEAMREIGMEILHAQEFNRMIPAGLPDDARVAHKTGEISSVCHDAGIVTLRGRRPYVLAILSEGGGAIGKRKEAVAAISKLLFDQLSGGEEAE